MHIKTILCPTDFSEFSDAALKYATALAADSGATLWIVHVHNPLPGPAGDYSEPGYVPESPATSEGGERERLQRVVPANSKVKFRHEMLHGEPATKIVQFAQSEGVDLIVLGSHGRTGLSRMLMGSVAEGVVRHAACPVLTVKQPLTEGA